MVPAGIRINTCPEINRSKGEYLEIVISFTDYLFQSDVYCKEKANEIDSFWGFGQRVYSG